MLTLLLMLVLYLAVGLALFIVLDAHPRTAGLFDHLSRVGEWCTWLLWPLAYPRLIRRARRGRR